MIITAMASKRRLRRKQCTGKVRYPNHKAAGTALYHMKRRGEFGLSVQRLGYKCTFCKKYHVGHRSAKRQHRANKAW